MIAFVMSGGGNRGALEAGALLELFEAGIQPDTLVGTSAGALNASFLATNPTLQGARKLADAWINAQKDDLFPGGWFSMIGRLAMRDYLSDPTGLGGLSFGVPRDVEPEPLPAGAEPYVPPWLR